LERTRKKRIGRCSLNWCQQDVVVVVVVVVVAAAVAAAVAVVAVTKTKLAMDQAF
jgi:hypothetical protein